jgi:hypothetical protein
MLKLTIRNVLYVGRKKMGLEITVIALNISFTEGLFFEIQSHF